MSTPQDKSLWKFTDKRGSFEVPKPNAYGRLYFPLANEGGILSSITPDLHGDIKTSYNSFLTLPVTVEDLHNSKANRNFWVHVEGKGPWSLTGVSAIQDALKFQKNNIEESKLEAGLLWHKVTRKNHSLGLESEIINFAPAANDSVEIMIVTVKNTGRSRIKITPTSAIPIFGRSADNLRDHHHVTSLLHRILSHPAGVLVKPTMSFDERGHKINEIIYSVLGVTENGEFPTGHFSTVADFVGESGDFEAPQAIIENWDPPQKDTKAYQGKSAMGALRFAKIHLNPGQSAHYVLLLGISDKESRVADWLKEYGSYKKALAALQKNKDYWEDKTSVISLKTQDETFNQWFRWVALQPILRKLFGCSFLPDFDYGRGGRGWRDLWQDCLALLLVSPTDTRSILMNNFNGVRIDGSNATIIGKATGEFIGDRNNITRVWMDHGVWPFLTLELYIQQTGDVDILFENVAYFRDRQLSRARRKDNTWTEEYGQKLKTKKGVVYEGNLLEHVLVQNLVQFFNVGEHNFIRLENADWNDGLDMAYERGESVTFSAFYASNLKKIADLIEKIAAEKKMKYIPLAKEILILLDRVATPKIDYKSPDKKRSRLARYFEAVEPVISGVQKKVAVKLLVADLREKSAHLTEAIRQKEWLTTESGDSFFNGYYDNHGRRVEGDHKKAVQMTLTGQVFPIMSGVATPDQIREIVKSAQRHLKDKNLGGYRLNTDFQEIRPDLGRAFSFAYGEKENGAFFSHMVVMYANALFQRGFVQEGREALHSIYRMSTNTRVSRIFPGMPEYFNAEGRGLYHYLTGSASWYVMTVLTQYFGVRGSYGHLCIAPKFTADDFKTTTTISLQTRFLGHQIKINYLNPKKLSYGQYGISKVWLNKKELPGLTLNQNEVVIPKETFLKLAKKTENVLDVYLH